MTLKQKNFQQAEDLTLIDWYIRFEGDGQDMRKIAEDHDIALKTIEELKLELFMKEKFYDS